ncbi:MAG: Leu/Phe/Val dehydrogenase [Clostridia bacterium]
MGIFERMAREGHEQLIFCQDATSDLKSVIGIHDTTLGSALGGCRMWDYPSEEEAIDDALALSYGMTEKSAITRTNHGGGKAVIWGDPRRDKDEALLRCFGRFVEGLGGRFITGTDVGTTGDDFVVASSETRWLVGLPEYAGGSGNTSITTAQGVLHGLRAAAAHVWGDDDLNGKRVAVQGVGKVGEHLVGLLRDAGCDIIVTDIDSDAVNRVTEDYQVESVKPEAIYDVDCDIFSPCALGNILNCDTVERLKCRIVAGAANNQLSEPQMGDRLHELGILYVPDYIINAGGLIQVADEVEGYDRDRVTRKTEGLYDLLLDCFARADEWSVAPFRAADRLVRERIRILGEINRIYLPR